jgi:hypothetical protein
MEWKKYSACLIYVLINPGGGTRLWIWRECAADSAKPVILAKKDPSLGFFVQKGTQNRVIWLFFLEKFTIFANFCKIGPMFRGFPTQNHSPWLGFLAKKANPSEWHIPVYQTYVSGEYSHMFGIWGWMCRSDGSVFGKKSLNMGMVLCWKTPKDGSYFAFANFSRKKK